MKLNKTIIIIIILIQSVMILGYLSNSVLNNHAQAEKQGNTIKTKIEELADFLKKTKKREASGKIECLGKRVSNILEINDEYIQITSSGRTGQSDTIIPINSIRYINRSSYEDEITYYIELLE